MASSSPRKTLSDPAAVFPQESSDRLLGFLVCLLVACGPLPTGSPAPTGTPTATPIPTPTSTPIRPSTLDLQATVEALAEQRVQEIRAATPSASPTSTLDIQATIDAAIELRLANIEATVAAEESIERSKEFLRRASQLLTPTAAPDMQGLFLMQDDVEDMVFQVIGLCVVAWEAADPIWETTHIDNGFWLIETTYAQFQSVRETLNMGRWGIREQSGEVFPYDTAAKNVERSLQECRATALDK